MQKALIFEEDGVQLSRQQGHDTRQTEDDPVLPILKRLIDLDTVSNDNMKDYLRKWNKEHATRRFNITGSRAKLLKRVLTVPFSARFLDLSHLKIMHIVNSDKINVALWHISSH